MEETLKMKKSILTGKEGKENINEIINKYKNELSPNILAYFYVDNYKLIYKTGIGYTLISTEDKASFCLQELDKCLQTYDINSKAKFITYFMTCYRRRLWAENEMLNHNIRKANIFCEDIDETNIINESDLLTDEDMILNNYNLTSDEIKQCKLLNMGYTIKEIAKILKVSYVTIYNRNDKIKQKILGMNINFA